MNKSVSFVGAGRVGTSLARLLYVKGYQIGALICRQLENAITSAKFVGSGYPSTDVLRALDADVVFITVPDDYIENICADLAKQGGFQPTQVVIHCSGVLGADSLRDAAQQGAAVLSLHPMQSVATAEIGERSLPGSFFGLEGSQLGLEFGNEIITALGGVPLVTRQGTKAAYHAGAVMASNYLVVLLDLAARLLESTGIERSKALSAVTMLAEGTMHNIRTQGIPAALTGPIERGDAGTVQKHLESLRGDKELLNTYVDLGKHALSLAEQKKRSIPIDYTYMTALLTAVLSTNER